jgi:hypothetical protein
MNPASTQAPAATCRREDPLHESGHIAVTHYVRLAGGKIAQGYKCVGCGKTSRTFIVRKS